MEATDAEPLRNKVHSALEPYQHILDAGINILSFRKNSLIPLGVATWVISFVALIVISRINFPVLFLAAMGFGLSRALVWAAPRIHIPQKWMPDTPNKINIDTISQFVVGSILRVRFEYRRLYDMAFGSEASFGSRFGAAIITLCILAFLRYVRMPVILAIAMGVIYAFPACVENDNLSEATEFVGRLVGPHVRAAKTQANRALNRVTRRVNHKVHKVAQKAEKAASEVEERTEMKAKTDPILSTPMSASSPTAGVGSE